MTTSASVPDYRDLTPDEWLAGSYTGVDDTVDSRFGATPVRGDASRKWKNVDYLRLRDVAIHLLDLAPGKRVLDIGCANGPTMIYLGLQGASVTGVDRDKDLVGQANRQLQRYGIDGEAVAADARTLPFGDGTFDAVISNDFVEHIDQQTKIEVLRETRRVLKPGCPVVTKTPNLAYLRLALNYKRLRALLSLKSPRGFVIPHTPGTANPDHIGLSTRWTFTKCLLSAGFFNYSFHYAPLRRFGSSIPIEILSTEMPVVRDLLCEDLFCRAYKPICASHFPG